MFGSDPPQNGMSRWGLAKILNHYIIQVPIIIFLVIFFNVSFLSPNIFHSSKFPIVCCKSPNFIFLPSVVLVPDISVISVTQFCLAPSIGKKGNKATQASPVYPRDTLSYVCQFQIACVEEKSHKLYQISEWHVRTFIHCHFWMV